MKRLIALSLTALSLVIAGCGGGGGSSATPPPTGTPTPTIPPSAQSAQQCAPDNPYTADATSATKTGSLTIEKQWIRSYFDESYLWYDSVPTVDPTATAYSGPMTTLDPGGIPLPISNYFEALKTKSVTPSGALTDKFSFTYSTKNWNQRFLSGATAGYGIDWAAIKSAAPNRVWRVASVTVGSQASAAGIVRGDTLKTVDGADFANTNDVNALNGGLFPAINTTHAFVFSRASSPDIALNLVATATTIDPVPLTSVVSDPAGRKVGYLNFTSHIATAEGKLIDAINTLKAANVVDLVLDLRYNSGGYEYIASELAYMIAGPTRTASKYINKSTYNAKRTTDNAQPATPFYDTSCYLDATQHCSKSNALPTLNLPRVFIISTGTTCSASELVINGLRGIDVDVQLIGQTTCGKPYGFSARDNCGITYNAMEFKAANFKGFGDYSDGFTPTSGTPTNTSIAGCASSDDLDHPIGNTSERMLSAALQRAALGSCPAAPAAAVKLESFVSAGQSVAGKPIAGVLLRIPSQGRQR